MPRKLTQEQFIERAKQVHGSKYDYSVTVYQNMQHKVEIICPVHGVFHQLPQPHLRGQGCPLCGQIKYKQSMMDKYGVDNPMKVASIKRQARKTCVDRYGHEWAMSSDDIKQKVTDTNRILYGVDRPLQNETIKKNMLETVQSRYNVSNVMAVDEFKAKHVQTCLSHYGMSEPLSSNVVRDKIKATNMVRYGGPAPMSSNVIRDKFKATCMDKYSVSHPSKLQDVLDKIQTTKTLNHSFAKSESEDILYQNLCDIFGTDDVIRQYKSDVYPFACDFYVKSRDMYIELNALWTHGCHWFNDDDIDTFLLEQWRSKHTDYYNNAIDTWAIRDVRKRQVAVLNDLNYIVFWDSNLEDFHLWIEMGCPDGNDAKKMYSWLDS